MEINELARLILGIQDKPWREKFVSAVEEYVQGGLAFLDYHKGVFSFIYDLHKEIIEEGGLGNSSRSAPKKLAAKMVRMAKVEPGDTVIDPCAGVGTLLKIAQKAGAKVMGYENQFHIYHATKYACPDLHIINGDFMTTPYGDGAYVIPDIVLLFPPIDNAQKFLRRICEVYTESRIVAVLPRGFFGKQTKPSDKTFLERLSVQKIVQVPREMLSHITTKKMAIYNLLVRHRFVGEKVLAGVLQWVTDYKAAHKAKNAKLAKQIKANIDEAIKEHELNPKTIFGKDPDIPE